MTRRVHCTDDVLRGWGRFGAGDRPSSDYRVMGMPGSSEWERKAKMGRHQAKEKYVVPEWREAKQFADECGRTYYEAMWKAPSLISQRYMIESAAKFTGYDCAKELQELDREIQRAIRDLPIAKENLQKARAKLAALKRSASNNGMG